MPPMSGSFLNNTRRLTTINHMGSGHTHRHSEYARCGVYWEICAKSLHAVVKRREHCSDGESICTVPAESMRRVFRPKRLLMLSMSEVKASSCVVFRSKRSS